MSTHRRQFGSVRKLGSGRWQARYRDGSGRRLTASDTFATRGDASRYLSMVEADMARGNYIDPRGGRLTLSAWAEEWLSQPGKRRSSVARDRQGLNMFKPSLGALPLGTITPSHVQSAVNARAEVVAPATIGRDFAALRAALNAAVDADLIGRSPARATALPRIRPPERVALSPEDLMKLVGETPDRYRALVLVGGVLGLRWGEAVGLRVCDVDFIRRTVRVGKPVEELAGHLSTADEPKSEAGKRTMAAPPFLIDELARHLAEYRSDAVGDPKALIFLGPRGGVLRRQWGARVFGPAVTRSGLPELTFHGLRHAAVSALVDEGVHPRVMAARAGHETARITMELYAHVSDDADREAARGLQERFGPLVARWGTIGAREGSEGSMGNTSEA